MRARLSAVQAIPQWLACECSRRHNRHGFPSEWLPRTFALATFGNGIVAVSAGIAANLLADPFGSDQHHPVRPFLFAIAVLGFTALALHKTWDENAVPEDELAEGHTDRCIAGLKPVLKNRKIWLVGLVQALFESAMFVFVFLWTPSLAEHKYRSPLGFIFATFMLAIVLGSTIFQLALSLKWPVTKCLESAICLAIACFLLAFLFESPSMLFVAFVGFEVACGVYYPAIGSLRGEIIPESDRAAIMGWFRVPINVFVITCLFATRILSHHALFGVCALLCCLALAVHKKMVALLNTSENEIETESDLSSHIIDDVKVKPANVSSDLTTASNTSPTAVTES